MSINSIGNVNLNIGSLEKNVNIKNDKNISFENFLKDAVYSVSGLEKKAEDMNIKFMTGEVENIHDVMIAGEKADIAVQSFIQVKNKVMDAYKEIMRIQI